jgi:two-component system phosphate regulon sensor histidine kinase PhoR
MGLHGLGLYRSYRTELEAIPERAERDQIRLEKTLSERFNVFLDKEETRPYYHYAAVYSPSGDLTDSLSMHDTPLIVSPAPVPILTWFQVNVDGVIEVRDDSVDLFVTDRLNQAGVTPENRQSLHDAAIAAVSEGLIEYGLPFRSRGDEGDLIEVPLSTAAVHADRAVHWDCLHSCFGSMEDRFLSMTVSRFKLSIFRDASGEIRLAAVRYIRAVEQGSDFFLDLPKGGICMDNLRYGFAVAQGFFLDPEWLFEELPSDAAAVALGGDTRLAVGAEARVVKDVDQEKLPLNLAALFDVDRAPGLVWPRTDAAIFVNRGAPADRFAGAIMRFGAVALMLLLSLGTGLVLMLRNVRQKLDQAAQTENFVAAVTHELRTPLASIKLHGEMLVDGIPQTPAARQEYYNRILGESERLSVLVENVLQKSSLDSERASSTPGDLSGMVRLLQDQLATHGMHHHGFDPSLTERGSDLAFELADDLPEVLLHYEAINGILRNLVGNARKYAAVPTNSDPSDQPAEAILVRTRLNRGKVLLEVADRGPGVPEEEQSRIFEAFYRMGNEGTRETPGTGLGLHLVVLHAQALNAKVSYKSRDGGGAIFEVAFPPA